MSADNKSERVGGGGDKEDPQVVRLRESMRKFYKSVFTPIILTTPADASLSKDVRCLYIVFSRVVVFSLCVCFRRLTSGVPSVIVCCAGYRINSRCDANLCSNRDR